MRKLYLFVLTVVTVQLAAQVYHPMLGNNITWKTYEQGMIGPFLNAYTTGGDTLIGPNNYTRLLFNGQPNAYTSYLREDSLNRRVYALVNGVDQLIYDFSMILGDSVYLSWQNGFYGPAPNNGYYHVDSIGVLNTLAGPRKLMRLRKQNGYSCTWIESVGILNNMLNYPLSYCDLLDCGVSVTPYCQLRNGQQAFELSPMYSCDSARVYDCSIVTNYTHVDSDYVFSVQVNSLGPFSYRWQLVAKDTSGHFNIVDSSFFPNAHFIILPNTEYYVNVYTDDTIGCHTGGGLHLYDSALVTPSSCSAFFWVYPDTLPGNYFAQNLSAGSNLNYAWDFGDGGTSNQQYPVHQYNAAGHYTICLTVSDNNGCNSTYCDSTFYNYKNGGGPMGTLNVVPVATGITESDASIFINLYPNPANAELFISNTGVTGLNVPQVYDLAGKLLILDMQARANGFVLNVSSLPQGLYVVVLNYGNNRVMKRFVK